MASQSIDTITECIYILLSGLVQLVGQSYNGRGDSRALAQSFLYRATIYTSNTCHSPHKHGTIPKILDSFSSCVHCATTTETESELRQCLSTIDRVISPAQVPVARPFNRD